MDNNLESLYKLKKEMDSVSLFSPFMNKKRREEIANLKSKLENLIEQVEKFDSIMSPRGWCFYDSFSTTVINKVNQDYIDYGIDAAEKTIINYYTNDVKHSIRKIIFGNPEFQIREKLILNAFDEHFNGRYYASIPLFLLIIDGAVNDFTKSKGFFAEGTDVTAWDCVVGCNNGLTAIKSMYVKNRTSLNTSPIEMPYRNGILHGRDINYDNVNVSCKCVNLLFAVSDWMKMKRTEEVRKIKFEKECNPPPISESLKRLKDNREVRKEISNWKRRKIVVGKDIPECGEISEYKDYGYVQAVVEMFDYWKTENYGKLSVKLKKIINGDNPKHCAGECKKLFLNNKFISYKILEVEEKAAALSRVLIAIKFKKSEDIVDTVWEFGCIYEDIGDTIAVPWRNNGNWEIIPWKMNDIYN